MSNPIKHSRVLFALGLSYSLVVACGGTTGREGLVLPAIEDASVPLVDAAPDTTLSTDAGDDALSDEDDAEIAEAGFLPPPPDDASQASDAPPEASGACCAISAACKACLDENCAPPNGSSVVPPCSGGSGVQGIATGGPAAGSKREDLCKAVYACVTQTKCGESSLNECYCGTAQGGGCLSPGAANGPCKTAIERGLETTDPATIATGFANTDLGGGVALELLSCAQQSDCWDACVAGDPTGHD